MIKVQDLSKNYGDVQAVKSINFEINDGEIVGFLGENGAGKTTTLKMLTGYLVPTAGNVEINDLNINDSALEIQKQIGYLPELNPLYPEMSVYEYLEFIARVRNITGKKFREALTRVVDRCGLQGVVHKEVSSCSKGYKQRIGLAGSMIHDPKILILDEPVTGLDPNQIVEIRGLIKSLGREKLVLMSSHILQEIQATVDRIMIIHQGEIVANGTNDELMSSFRGNTLLNLEVRNTSEKSLKDLSVAVPNIDISNMEEKKDHHLIQLEYSQEVDPREDLFNYAVSSGWIILKMTPTTTDLEDIFRKLTMEGKADA
ncbi:MAG: ABC transporter ATP-binding protein [Candidatus Neomarinimicrobiota bacterium]|nr:MAG: ATP-binding cassette domain-containing protein [bacterium]|tara:strand:- start:4770 stop:5714 length:945 start_codon:yes stop_codon:yes gene_type:complete